MGLIAIARDYRLPLHIAFAAIGNAPCEQISHLGVAGLTLSG